MKPNTLTVIFASLALALLFSLPILSNLTLSNTTHGHALNTPVNNFSGRDSQGITRALSDYKGKFIYLIFGYTHCNAVCPLQAHLLQQFDKQWQELNLDTDNDGAKSNSDIHYLFVSLDPENDDTESVTAFFDNRGSRFTGLKVEDPDKLRVLLRSFHEQPFKNIDNSISHTGNIYLLDPKGKLRIRYTSGQLKVQHLISDLRKIRATLKGPKNSRPPSVGSISLATQFSDI